MVSMLNRIRYIALKSEYAIERSGANAFYDKLFKSKGDMIFNVMQSEEELRNSEKLLRVLLKSFIDKLTFVHWNKGEEMSPTIGGQGSLLVRKLPAADSCYVFVGDVVVLKNPENSNDYLVRRLAAVEGCEMASSNEEDEPFVLEEDECWVLADNKSLKPKEAKDSRVFGPVPMTSIIRRVIYSLRNAADHGPVLNSPSCKMFDDPILKVELDVDEMAKSLKG